MWTRAPFDEITRREVEAMIAAGGDELIEAFYTDLEFGTGGLRGIMGHGTNRMNAYTVAMAVVTMGGVIAAGTLSLFIIPVVYTWLDRLSRA